MSEKGAKIGYVKMYRKMLDDDIFKNAGALQLFMYCIFSAQHKNTKNLRKGELLTSYSEITKVTGMSRPTIIKFMKFLKDRGAINYETNFKKTKITVLNFEKYNTNSKSQL